MNAGCSQHLWLSISKWDGSMAEYPTGSFRDVGAWNTRSSSLYMHARYPGFSPCKETGTAGCMVGQVCELPSLSGPGCRLSLCISMRPENKHISSVLLFSVTPCLTLVYSPH